MVKRVLLASAMICFILAFVGYSLFICTQPSIETTEFIIAIILAVGAMTFAMVYVTNANKKK